MPVSECRLGASYLLHLIYNTIQGHYYGKASLLFLTVSPPESLVCRGMEAWLGTAPRCVREIAGHCLLTKVDT